MSDALHQGVQFLKRLSEVSMRSRLAVEYHARHQDGCKGGPYPWQCQAHEAGAKNSEVMICAANQTGKTRTDAAEISVHATGRYPSWWRGRRWDRPVNIIVAGQTNEDLRDIQQKALVGEHGEGRTLDGTGWIPRECFGPHAYRQCGITNVLDYIKVRHVSGGWSHISFKSYQQGWEAFKGREVDLIWLDEEPDDFKIFTECQTRVMTRSGLVLFTNTPLKGMSQIVAHFLEGGIGIAYVPATWDDAPHLSADQKTAYRSRYPEHERDARTKGIPMMGTGLVYNIPDEMILVDSFPLPRHFRRICGVDFGIDHPAAAVWLAYDADADILYLYDCYKEKGQTPLQIAPIIISRGAWIPVAWPHDGMVRDKGSGVPLANQYRKHGVNMLPEPARWSDEMRLGRVPELKGAQSREAGCLELLDRMHSGRFKVIRGPQTEPFMQEKRMIHRKEGQIILKNDDAESAVRYAMMSLQFAISDAELDQSVQTQTVAYDPLASMSL